MSIFNINLGENFFASLLQGIEERIILKQENGQSNALLWSNVKIFFPNRRSCRKFTEFLISKNKNATCLPRIMAISDIEGSVGLESVCDGFKVINKVDQRILVTKLIYDLYHIRENLEDAPIKESYRMAIDLIELLAKLNDAQINVADFNKLVDIEPSLAKHWQKNIEILNVILQFLPEIMQEKKYIDYNIHRNLMIESQSKIWNMSDDIIIFAGIDSQIKSIMNCFKILHNKRNCYFVLNGLDQKNIDFSQSQFKFKKLFNYINYDGHIEDWCKNPPIKNPNVNYDFKQKSKLTEFEYVEANDLIQESKIIALKIKEFLFLNQNNSKTACVITNNTDLSIQLIEKSKKFSIKIDDSEGVEISKSQYGSLFFILVELAYSGFTPGKILEFLKHPLMMQRILNDDSMMTDFISRLEIDFFRKVRFGNGLAELISEIKKENSEIAENLDGILSNNDGFFDLLMGNIESFKSIISSHLAFFKNLLSPSESGDAEDFVNFIEEIIESAHLMGDINSSKYLKIIDSLLTGNKLRQSMNQNARVFIMNPNEVDLLNFDLTIIASCNEGNFPSAINQDPWLTQSIKEKIGLASPFELIGNYEHMFISLLSRNNVFITRSLKDSASENISSRFLVKLLLYVEKFYPNAKNNQTEKWQEICNISDFRDVSLNFKLKRPEFAPPIASLPEKISVSKVEQLIRDPYGYYLSAILKFKPLDEVDRDPAAVDFGNVIHKILDEFSQNYNSSENKLLLIREIGTKEIAKYYSHPVIMSLWQPRFEEISSWVVEFERNRRQNSVQILSEISGSMQLEFSNGRKIKVTAKADRVEVGENMFNILDYKTGVAPTSREVRKGVSPQLLIEALVMQNFEQKPLNLQDMLYVTLTGRKKIGEIYEVDLKDSEFLVKFLQELEALLALYFESNYKFSAVPNLRNQPKFNNFRHLERCDDWS